MNDEGDVGRGFRESSHHTGPVALFGVYFPRTSPPPPTYLPTPPSWLVLTAPDLFGLYLPAPTYSAYTTDPTLNYPQRSTDVPIMNLFMLGLLTFFAIMFRRASFSLS